VRWFCEQVWPRIRAVRSDARFLVVGAGVPRSIRQLAAADPSIELAGQVSTVQPYLWRSAVSVAPLHLARGLQNKVLEALAAELPVVVTPRVFDGLPIEARVGCVVAGQPDDFAAGVSRLLAASAEERRQLARAVPLDRLTWAERFHDLEGILREASRTSRLI
jgi:glycosyltransferase involved in cell wall biosynthesis